MKYLNALRFSILVKGKRKFGAKFAEKELGKKTFN